MGEDKKAEEDRDGKDEETRSHWHSFPNTVGVDVFCRYGCGCYIDAKGAFKGPDGREIGPFEICPKS